MPPVCPAVLCWGASCCHWLAANQRCLYIYCRVCGARQPSGPSPNPACSEEVLRDLKGADTKPEAELHAGAKGAEDDPKLHAPCVCPRRRCHPACTSRETARTPWHPGGGGGKERKTKRSRQGSTGSRTRNNQQHSSTIRKSTRRRPGTDCSRQPSYPSTRSSVSCCILRATGRAGALFSRCVAVVVVITNGSLACRGVVVRLGWEAESLVLVDGQ